MISLLSSSREVLVLQIKAGILLAGCAFRVDCLDTVKALCISINEILDRSTMNISDFTAICYVILLIQVCFIFLIQGC